MDIIKVLEEGDGKALDLLKSDSVAVVKELPSDASTKVEFAMDTIDPAIAEFRTADSDAATSEPPPQPTTAVDPAIHNPTRPPVKSRSQEKRERRSRGRTKRPATQAYLRMR